MNLPTKNCDFHSYVKWPKDIWTIIPGLSEVILPSGYLQ